MKDLIMSAYSTQKGADNFNVKVVELLNSKGTVSKFDLLELNLKERLKSKFDAEYDENNKDHTEFVQKTMKTAKNQTDMCLSNSKNKAAFNFWAEQEGRSERLKWNKEKTIVSFK